MPTYFTPAQIRHAYGFDYTAYGSIVGDGSGQTIAIVDAYDDPKMLSSTDPNFATSDLAIFDAHFGIPDPPSFKKVSQTGGSTSSITPDTGWASEISLDVEWTHALAPKANIVLVEASAPDINLFEAVQYAASIPGVCDVSMSWGGSEDTTTPLNNNFDYYANSTYFVTPTGHQGVTFLQSTGDSGSPGNEKFSNVVEVGGTSLTLNNDNTWSNETAWSGSGGGTSAIFTEPSWQQGFQNTGYRTVPDVSFDADPNTGVVLYDSYGYSGYVVFGGTSLSCPCWAAIIAISDQFRVANGETTLDGPSQTLPAIYDVSSTGIYGLSSYDFHDVISGSNGGFSAGPGYDEVTGRGSPFVNLLTNDLAGVSGNLQYDCPDVATNNISVQVNGSYIEIWDNGSLVEGKAIATTSEVIIDGAASTTNNVVLQSAFTALGIKVDFVGGSEGSSGDLNTLQIDGASSTTSYLLSSGSCTINGTTVFSYTGLNSLTVDANVTGATNPNTITVDFTSGNPIPAGGLTIQDGNLAGDNIVLQNGTMTTSTYNFTDASDGTISLLPTGASSASTIAYQGISALTSLLTTTNALFDYNQTSQSITIAADTGNTTLTAITSTAGASLNILNPLGTFQVFGDDPGTGTDVISLNGYGSGGSNAFTAALTINAGTGNDTIKVNAPLALGSTTSTGNIALTAKTIDLNSSLNASLGSTSGTITLTGAVFLTGSTAITYGGTNSLVFTGPINLGNFTLTLTDLLATNTESISSSISGNGGIITAGPGILTLSGTDSFSGSVSVNAGTLIVTGTLSGGGTITVAAGGLLEGTGTISGPVSVSGGLTPGTSTPGAISVGNLSFGSGGNFTSELLGTTVGGSSGYNQVVVNGTVNLTGANLLLASISSTLAVGNSFTILSNGGTGSITGTFNGLPQGAVITTNLQSFQISYTGGTNGKSVTLTVIAPTVISSSINGGAIQRSRVTQISLTFSETITIGSNAFSMTNGSATITSASGGGILVNQTTSNGTTIVTLTFDSSNSNIQYGSLSDGYWTLTVNASAISGSKTGFAMGSNYTQKGIIRLFGDITGDGAVDSNDLTYFGEAYGSSSGNSSYISALDFNQDGSIDSNDLTQFGTRYGSSISGPYTPNFAGSGSAGNITAVYSPGTIIVYPGAGGNFSSGGGSGGGGGSSSPDLVTPGGTGSSGSSSGNATDSSTSSITPLMSGMALTSNQEIQTTPILVDSRLVMRSRSSGTARSSNTPAVSSNDLNQNSFLPLLSSTSSQSVSPAASTLATATTPASNPISSEISPSIIVNGTNVAISNTSDRVVVNSSAASSEADLFAGIDFNGIRI